MRGLGFSVRGIGFAPAGGVPITVSQTITVEGVAGTPIVVAQGIGVEGQPTTPIIIAQQIAVEGTATTTPKINDTQTIGVDSFASTLGVIAIVQGIAVEGTATTVSVSPAQVEVDVSKATITLGATMRVLTGTPTVPVVTLTAGTGSLTYDNSSGSGCPGLFVAIDSVAGGTARGQATFKISYNNGSTFAHTGVLTAATYTIPDGPAAGNVVNFATGTYATDQTWENTIASIRSTEGNLYTFALATVALQPLFRKAAVTPDGKDAIYQNAGTQYLASTDAGVLALFTNDPALTVMCRVHYTTADAVGYWLSACDSAQPTNRKRAFGQSNAGTSGLLRQIATNDAGSALAPTSTADPSFPNAAHNECWYGPGSNGGANLTVDDAARTLGSTGLNIGTLTPTRVALGCEADSTPSNGVVGYMYRWAVFNSQLSSGDRTAWNTKFTNGT